MKEDRAMILKYLIGALLLASIAGTASAQKIPIPPTPTVDQCHADAEAWTNDSQFKEEKELPVVELERRQHEMMTCVTIIVNMESNGDATHAVRMREGNLYFNANDYIETIISYRYRKFIKRHSLLDKFYKEDEAGSR
jgi:hypothetical protein